MHVVGVSLAKVWSIVVITAVGVMALGLVLHRTFDHGDAGDRTEAQIEARDQAARDRAVAAGRAAEQQEEQVLDGETDDQVLAGADPAVRAAVARAIADHEWRHHPAE